MRTIRHRLLPVIAAATLGFSAQAADQYEFDKVHTQVLFFADHLGFSKSQGEFLDFDGGFTFDGDNWANSSVDVTIKTASITMDDKKWDDHMKNEDFFHVEKHPEMRFVSKKVESADGKTGKIIGELTILGVTKPAVLDVTFNKAAIHPFSKKFVAGFSATTTIKRSQYGMNYGLPFLGDDIEVRLEVEGMRK